MFLIIDKIITKYYSYDVLIVTPCFVISNTNRKDAFADMNTQQLKSFIKVAENLSFSKAAEQLYISIPSISRNIKLIEEELGATLFLRDKHRVQLTKAGQSFYADAKLLLKAHEQAILHIQEGNRSSQLRICCTSYEELVLITDTLRKFRAKNPDIAPKIQCANHAKCISLLKLQEIDLMLGSESMAPREQDIKFQPLCRLDYFALVPESDALSGRDIISFEEELEDRTIIHMPELMIPFHSQNRIRDLLAVHHRHSHDIECEDDLVCIALAQAGYGITVLPEYKIPSKVPGCVKVRLMENESFEYGVLTNINECPQAANTFINLMKSRFS